MSLKILRRVRSPWEFTTLAFLLAMGTFLMSGCQQEPQEAVSVVKVATPQLPPRPQPVPGLRRPETDISRQPEGRTPDEILASQPQDKQVDTQLRYFAIALITYRCHVGRFPNTDEGLEVLLNPPGDLADPQVWKGPYSSLRLTIDPWGNPFQYRWLDEPMKLYELRSLGPDGIENSTDDVVLTDVPDTDQLYVRAQVERFVKMYESGSAYGDVEGR